MNEKQLTPDALSKARILLIEDEPLIALEIEDICREHGAAVVMTVRDNKAAASVDFSLFDIAVVDLIVDGESSLPLARRLRDHAVPFFFSSGYADAPEVQAEFPEHVILAKPYGSEALLAALCALLPARSQP